MKLLLLKARTYPHAAWGLSTCPTTLNGCFEKCPNCPAVCPVLARGHRWDQEEQPYDQTVGDLSRA